MAATMEASQTLIQSESRVQRSYQEVSGGQETKVRKKKSMRRHKDEGTVSVSKSSEKLHKKLKANAEGDSNPQCAKCERAVYAMERVKAERRVWHKECFRCVQCNKQLTVETYESDHTTLYCRPHFKQLFGPKPVEGDDQTDAAPRKHQMIICESNPVELPPDVVRASDKPDLGLEELSQLDVKSRFQVFERGPQEPQPLEPQQRGPREKSTALLSKLAKFKAKGMDVGVSDEYLNGVPVEASSSEQEDEEDEDSVLKKSYKHTVSKEAPVSFCNMNEIVGKFESGQHVNEERHRERKQEIQNIRSRLFMGKQAKIKEQYEQSVLQSEQSKTSADKIAQELDMDMEKARSIKQRFETGQVFNDENQPPKNREIDDRALFNEAEKARSIKNRFESGEAFRDEKQVKNKEDYERTLFDEAEKARAIKNRFESGEAFRDEKQLKNKEDYERTLYDEADKARSIKDRFESGEAFRDEKPVKNRDGYERVLFDEVEKSKIKNRFESGEAFRDEKQVKNRDDYEKTFFDEAEKARSIKDRFESGEVFRDEKPVKKRDGYERVLFDEVEKTKIKNRFESGEAFRDEIQVKNRDDFEKTLFDEAEKARSIKDRFESGEAFRDVKPVKNRDGYERVLFDEVAKAKIMNRFESGEAFRDEKQVKNNKDIDDETLFDQGIGKKSRSIFLELDANAKTIAPLSPPAQEPPKRKEIPFIPKDLVRADDKPEEVKIETADIQGRFKFFETYKPEATKKEFRMTPPRQTQRPKSPSPEIYHDPSVARGNEPVDVSSAAERHTASRMINVFRKLEEDLTKQEDGQGPKPLKRFTPPPPGESNHRGDSSEYSSEEEDSEEELRRLQHEARMRDEALRQAQQLARTKSFRGRFEYGSSKDEETKSPSTQIDIERQPMEDDDGESQLETAKSLRAKFENLQVSSQTTVTKTVATKVNRFV